MPGAERRVSACRWRRYAGLVSSPGCACRPFVLDPEANWSASTRNGCWRVRATFRPKKPPGTFAPGRFSTRWMPRIPSSSRTSNASVRNSRRWVSGSSSSTRWISPCAAEVSRGRISSLRRACGERWTHCAEDWEKRSFCWGLARPWALGSVHWMRCASRPRPSNRVVRPALLRLPPWRCWTGSGCIAGCSSTTWAGSRAAGRGARWTPTNARRC